MGKTTGVNHLGDFRAQSKFTPESAPYQGVLKPTQGLLEKLLLLPQTELCQIRKEWRVKVHLEPLVPLFPILEEFGYIHPQRFADLDRPFERALFQFWQWASQNPQRINQQFPLTVFWWDDIQWVDTASWRFFSHYLLRLPLHFVFSGRSLPAIWEHAHSSVHKIHLNPLSFEEFQDYLRTSHMNLEQQKLLYANTAGNFFELHWWLHHHTPLAKDKWEEWMQSHWEKQTRDVQDTLRFVSLWGRQISALHISEANLKEAVAAGFLQRTQTHYRWVHDRVQTWVKNRLRPEDQKDQEKKIRNTLLALPASERTSELLYLGMGLLSSDLSKISPEETDFRWQAVQTFLEQGNITEAQIAAESLKATDDSQTLLLARLSYLQHHNEAALQSLVPLLKHPLSQSLDAHLLKIVIDTQHNRYAEVCHNTAHILSKEGWNPSSENADERLSQMLSTLQNVTQEEWIERACSIQDPVFDRQIQILSTAAAAFYNHDPQWFGLYILHAMKGLLNHSGARRAGTIYTSAAMIVAGGLRDFTLADQLIEAAHQIAERQQDPADATTIYCVMGDFIKPWQKGLDASQRYFDMSWQTGLASGNLQFAGYACVFKGANLFLSAMELDTFVQDVLPDMLEFTQKTRNFSPFDGLTGYRHLAHYLQQGDFDLHGSTEASFIARLRERHSKADLSRYFLYKAFVLCLSSHRQAALDALKEALVSDFLPGSIVEVLYYLLIGYFDTEFSSEPSAALFFETIASQTEAPLITGCYALYKAWNAPGFEEKLRGFEAAISAFKSNHCWHLLGWCYDFLQKLYQEQGLSTLAQDAQHASQQAYEQWGAQHLLNKVSSSQRPSQKRDVSWASLSTTLSQSQSFESLGEEIAQHLERQGIKGEMSLHIIQKQWSTVYRNDSTDQVVSTPLLNYIKNTRRLLLHPGTAQLGFNLSGWPPQGMPPCFLLPLIFREEVIGVLSYVLTEEKDHFPESFQHIIRGSAALLSGACARLLQHNNLETLVKERTTHLEHLLAERKQMLAMAAHDLKHPMGTLQLGISLLECSDLASEERDYTFEALHQTLWEMNQNTERLLLSQTLEENALEVSPSWFQAAELRNALSRWDWQAKEKSQQLVWQGFAKEPLCFADFNLLKLVLDNLISNALKFSPLGASIEIRARHSPYWCWEVEDQAPALSSEEQHKITDKYYTLHKPTATEKSTGLGLYLVKQLLPRLGYTLKISQGATGNIFAVEND